MWEDGIFLGVKGTTGEMFVGDAKGVWRTRTIRRKPFEERWGRENLKLVGGVPWKMNEEVVGDGEKMKDEVVIMDKDYKERRQVEDHVKIPRAVFIKEKDLEEFGFTKGCPGCVAVMRGTTRQAHTEGCRARMENNLEGTCRM